MTDTDSWKRRWLVIQVCLVASILLAVGLFLISTAHAAAIAPTVGMIVLTLLGFVGVYVSGAVVDDASRRKALTKITVRES